MSMAEVIQEIKILPDTKIHKMPYICKARKCKKSFIVNVG